MKISIPGIGGNLGQCVYCGDNFAKELLLNEKISMPDIGGIECPMHNNCLSQLQKLATDNGIEFSIWDKLPEKSPLREELIKLEKAI